MFVCLGFCEFITVSRSIFMNGALVFFYVDGELWDSKSHHSLYLPRNEKSFAFGITLKSFRASLKRKQIGGECDCK